MTAMPAEKWTVFDREIREEAELDRLIDAVAYYQELALEYPTTAFYHRQLEAARSDLRKAEKRHPGARGRWHDPHC